MVSVNFCVQICQYQMLIHQNTNQVAPVLLLLVYFTQRDAFEVISIIVTVYSNFFLEVE